MFERNVEFRKTDFSKVDETNSLLKPFYNNINYNDNDDYSKETKMVLKSSSSLDFVMDCHFINLELFKTHDDSIQVVSMAKIYESINGGTVKNDKGIVIAHWAELPKKYMKVIHYLSYKFVHLIQFIFREMIFLSFV